MTTTPLVPVRLVLFDVFGQFLYHQHRVALMRTQSHKRRHAMYTPGPDPRAVGPHTPPIRGRHGTLTGSDTMQKPSELVCPTVSRLTIYVPALNLASPQHHKSVSNSRAVAY